jgi:hypothetical protein
MGSPRDHQIVAYFRAVGKRSPEPCKNKRREEIPRRLAGLIARSGSESR